MKLYEFIRPKESDLNEAPVGALSQKMQSLGSKVLSHVPGAGNISSRLRGKADVGKAANILHDKFQQWLARANISPSDVTGDIVRDFLNHQGIAANISGNTTLSKSQIDKAFLNSLQTAEKEFYSNKPRQVPSLIKPSNQHEKLSGLVSQINKLSPEEKKELLQQIKPEVSSPGQLAQKRAEKQRAAKEKIDAIPPKNPVLTTSPSEIAQKRAEKQRAAKEKIDAIPPNPVKPKSKKQKTTSTKAKSPSTPIDRKKAKIARTRAEKQRAAKEKIDAIPPMPPKPVPPPEEKKSASKARILKRKAKDRAKVKA